MKAFQHKLSDPLPTQYACQCGNESAPFARCENCETLEQETRREQWDAEREQQEHENDLRWESLMADESEYGPTENGFPWK